jgi:hypothetical protein
VKPPNLKSEKRDTSPPLQTRLSIRFLSLHSGNLIVAFFTQGDKISQLGILFIAIAVVNNQF